MTEYIEREAALALAESEEYLTPDGDEIYHEYVPVPAVKSIPAADVRPVKNTCATCDYCNRDIAVGKWEGACRYWKLHSIMLDDWCSRYRPNCGAKMEGN